MLEVTPRLNTPVFRHGASADGRACYWLRLSSEGHQAIPIGEHNIEHFQRHPPWVDHQYQLSIEIYLAYMQQTFASPTKILSNIQLNILGMDAIVQCTLYSRVSHENMFFKKKNGSTRSTSIWGLL